MDTHPDLEPQAEDARLVYALFGAQLVHVSEVSRGLDCGCICPHCLAALIARQGEIRVAHFAHQGGQPCYWARETAIHLLAKEIISRHSALELPEVRSRDRDRVLTGARRISYNRVRVEQRFHDIIPDIIVTTEGGDLIIEVFVTNKVRNTKVEKIRQQKTRAIEVDVRNLRHVLNRTEVESQIIEETDHKFWLYTPEFDSDLPPSPKPVYLPQPLSSESAESTALMAKRRAEAEAAYKPPTRYVVPQRLSAEHRAMMMGQLPAKCKLCGKVTTNWASIECETGFCICRPCVPKATAMSLS